MQVTIIFKNTTKVVNVVPNTNLLKVLQDNGADIQTDCGGIGKCGKCKVKVLSGKFDNVKIDKDGNVLSCIAKITNDIVIKVDSELIENKKDIDVVDKIKGKVGIAFDLGTTTLAFSLVDIDNKKVLEQFTVLNKQAKFGADVISRISKCNEGHLINLHQIIIDQLNEAISYFKKKYQIDEISKVTVAANTTMLHIFMNVSPKGIGFAPYTPEFLDKQEFKGDKLDIDAKDILVLPSCSAFIGADITSGAAAIDLPDNSILIDLGTNGEVMYRLKDKYITTSTAAGPCLEGASIDCGLGGVNGAICKFQGLNGTYDYMTIGNASVRGICGAGLVDMISCLLKDEIIDETGSLNVEGDKFMIDENIYLSSSDVRKFQLAKSAIYSGVYALIKETGLNLEDIETFYLAGGIGYHIDIDSAINVGLLPKCAKGKVKVAGNSSLRGCELSLIDDEIIERMVNIASNSSTIDLNHSAIFTEAYIENMFF